MTDQPKDQKEFSRKPDEKLWEKNGGYVGLLLGMGIGVLPNWARASERPMQVLGITILAAFIGAIIGSIVAKVLAKFLGR